jgi:hypothetical protein
MKKAINTNSKVFNYQKAYEGLVKNYNNVKEEEQKKENTILLNEIQKLTKGKEIVMDNYIRK